MPSTGIPPDLWLRIPIKERFHYIKKYRLDQNDPEVQDRLQQLISELSTKFSSELSDISQPVQPIVQSPTAPQAATIITGEGMVRIFEDEQKIENPTFDDSKSKPVIIYSQTAQSAPAGSPSDPQKTLLRDVFSSFFNKH